MTKTHFCTKCEIYLSLAFWRENSQNLLEGEPSFWEQRSKYGIFGNLKPMNSNICENAWESKKPNWKLTIFRSKIVLGESFWGKSLYLLLCILSLSLRWHVKTITMKFRYCTYACCVTQKVSRAHSRLFAILHCMINTNRMVSSHYYWATLANMRSLPENN